MGTRARLERARPRPEPHPRSAMAHPLTRTLLCAAALVGLALRTAPAQATDRSPRPATVVPDTLATLSAGGGSTCVTTTRGAGWCWGALGTGIPGALRLLDKDGRPAVLRSLSPWGWNVCGLTASEDVVCSVGLAGGWIDSAGRAVAVPPGCRGGKCLPPLPIRGALPAGPVRAVTTGASHACALTPAGAAFCWGRNRMGQLGNGTRAADSTGSGGEVTRAPTAVAGGLRFARLDAGEDLTCGVTQPDGIVFCWGYGQSGQTGDSAVATYCDGKRPYYTSTCSVAIPARVRPESLPGDHGRPDDIRFAEVSAGMRLACAVDVVGSAYCWGNNYRCALGRCRSADSPRAHRIPMPGRVVEIGAGYWHACARTADSRVYCWGDNVAGQLGSLVSANAGLDGLPPDYRDTTDAAAASAAYRDDPCFLGGRCSPAPVEVSPGRRWAALAVGSDHACALAADDGGIYCWGGSDSAVFAGIAPLEQCVNRSTQWRDVRCQATPLRVPGLPPLAAPAIARRRAVPPEPVRVRVSRREVRIAFPADMARAWGWSERQDPNYLPAYAWGVMIEGMDGTRTLAARAGRVGQEARDFPSLERLIQAARVQGCSGGMIAQCSDFGMQASVEDGRVVLTLRDSAQISRLFGMRPVFVSTWQQRPEEGYRFSRDSVRVEYVSPQIPVPDAATRADAARSRRRFEESIRSTSRYISGGGDRWGRLWLVVGDSAAVHVDEMRCTYDACISSPAIVGDSGWTIDDPRVARVQSAVLDTSNARFPFGPARNVQYVKALRPGRTTLRVRGVHGPSDTAVSRRPPQRKLEREIIVTPPIGRVEIVTRPDTLRVRELFTFRVRVADRAGNELAGVPATLEVLDGDGRYVRDASGPVQMGLTSSGRTRIVARLGVHTDTLAVMVIAPESPRP